MKGSLARCCRESLLLALATAGTASGCDVDRARRAARLPCGAAGRGRAPVRWCDAPVRSRSSRRTLSPLDAGRRGPHGGLGGRHDRSAACSSQADRSSTRRWARSCMACCSAYARRRDRAGAVTGARWPPAHRARARSTRSTRRCSTGRCRCRGALLAQPELSRSARGADGVRGGVLPPAARRRRGARGIDGLRSSSTGRRACWRFKTGVPRDEHRDQLGAYVEAMRAALRRRGGRGPHHLRGFGAAAEGPKLLCRDSPIPYNPCRFKGDPA